MQYSATIYVYLSSSRGIYGILLENSINFFQKEDFCLMLWNI